MTRANQLDFFESESQDDLFAPDYAPPAYRGDPDRVRARLHKILAEARAARTLPWDAESARLYQTIFPQMTQWLPEEEAAQLRFAFEAEMARLDAGRAP